MCSSLKVISGITSEAGNQTSRKPGPKCPENQCQFLINIWTKENTPK